jgi:RimJ/RimL family protein N-acetyltransferase
MIRFEKIEDFCTLTKQLQLFMQSVRFGRYLSDSSLDVDNAIQYELSVMENYINNSGVCYLAISEENIVNGIIGFHYSSWDTDVLAKRTAIIKYLLIKEVELYQDRDISSNLVDIFHAWAKENLIDVAIVKPETRYFTPIIVLQEKGYMFYECNTIKTISLKTDNKWDFSDIQFRYAKADDLENLKKFALKNTFKKSHFYLDTKFDLEKVDLFYAKWIDSALNSNQKIVLIEYENNIAGVFIYDIEGQTNLFKGKHGIWKFAAVDSSLRNKGLGLALFQAVMQSCIDHNVDVIDTDLVEKNIVSQRIHDKFGFKLVHTLYTFHKWFT